ncbi:hypothetical protein IAQ61_006011 [Plenodomus lingam]|uniref:uncharacterized protein n=1 Tax=Leptosphaeria maculans TaxID=5022 RepID=UPI00332806D4|nr:hypothetical protein IAQ61_006011 [Plenodomus lingam]
MAEQVARELGALFEVFGGGITGFPLTEAVGAVVDVGGLDVFVEGFRRLEHSKAEYTRSMLPREL